MKLAVIPARGGSKRIPRKNVKEFCGKPIIAWSIEAALQSGCFDEVVVSTDDAEIAEVAHNYGAAVPFIRPADLSDDHTGTTSVIRHAIEWFNGQGQAPDPVCCLYATAPFLTVTDIRQGLDVLSSTGANYAFSVARYASPIQRAMRITAAGRAEMFHPEQFSVRSQDLEDAYHDAGQFYWGRAEAWLQDKMVFSPGAATVILPRHRVQDIDTVEDWAFAERLFQILQTNSIGMAP